ncbi:unnamed protein product [Gongylonema pulchrum]|uniref:Cadherin domain-containing protein n=1 Tax=Gongylonema pulchrum TaxID=637853 RepID=A0A3P6SSR9_9BILA|nr:unnamed protein product [Gongylonema pulchrum]
MSYSFIHADAQFSIDSDGRINTTMPLKLNQSYHLTVKNAKPRLLNEDRWTRLTISDADAVGETIGLIEADDPDGDQLWWKLTDGNYNNTFAIRCDTGELYLAKSLDYISMDISEVKLKFVVSDGLNTTEGTVSGIDGSFQEYA